VPFQIVVPSTSAKGKGHASPVNEDMEDEDNSMEEFDAEVVSRGLQAGQNERTGGMDIS